MKGVADRTLELMNEYQESMPRKSWRTFQHFLVVKIETLEDEIKKIEINTDAYADENEALVKIVAQSAHEEHCYAEKWWDSSCDCGLMDLVLQLSPRLQNAIDDERKSWEDKSIYSSAAKGFLEGRKIDTLIVDPPDALLTGE